MFWTVAKDLFEHSQPKIILSLMLNLLVCDGENWTERSRKFVFGSGVFPRGVSQEVGFPKLSMWL